MVTSEQSVKRFSCLAITRSTEREVKNLETGYVTPNYYIPVVTGIVTVQPNEILQNSSALANTNEQNSG